MSRLLSITLIVLSLAVGILLGNSYGRRDLKNSRPPEITGQIGEPGSVAVADNGYILGHLQLFNKAKISVFGGVALLKITNFATEANVDIWKMPEGTTGDESTQYILALYTKDHAPLKELTTFYLGQSGSAKLRVSVPEFEPGQYFTVLRQETREVLLVSEAVE